MWLTQTPQSVPASHAAPTASTQAAPDATTSRTFDSHTV